jgi:hypothetical protein
MVLVVRVRGCTARPHGSASLSLDPFYTAERPDFSRFPAIFDKVVNPGRRPCAPALLAEKAATRGE